MPEMEKNIISEEDLEKAAGGLSISSSTLKKGLIAAGILAAGAGVGGYFIINKKKGSKGAAPAKAATEPAKDGAAKLAAPAAPVAAAPQEPVAPAEENQPKE